MGQPNMITPPMMPFIGGGAPMMGTPVSIFGGGCSCNNGCGSYSDNSGMKSIGKGLLWGSVAGLGIGLIAKFHEPIWNGIKAAGQGIAKGAVWLWDNALKPAGEWIYDKVLCPIGSFFRRLFGKD